MQQGIVHAKDQRRTQHAFVADQSHFQAGQSVQRSDQGNHALKREIDLPGAWPGLSQDIGECQFDRLAAGQEAQAMLARQGIDQQIGGRVGELVGTG